MHNFLARYHNLLTVGLLIGLIVTYALFFSWFTINRHNTLNSYTADLTLIDQPMWNSVIGPGRRDGANVG